MASKRHKPDGPRRTLLAFTALVLALVALLAGAHFNGTATLTPKLGLDLEGGTQMVLSPRLVGNQKVTTDQVNQARDIIAQRVDSQGVSGAEVTTQGENNIVVSMPDVPSRKTEEDLRRSSQMQFRPVLAAAPSGAPVVPNPTASPGSTSSSTSPSGSGTSTSGSGTSTSDSGTTSGTTTSTGSASTSSGSASTSSGSASTSSATGLGRAPAAGDSATASRAQARSALPAAGTTSSTGTSTSPAGTSTSPSSGSSTGTSTSPSGSSSSSSSASSSSPTSGSSGTTAPATPTGPTDPAWVTADLAAQFQALDCSKPGALDGVVDDPEKPLLSCLTDGTEKYILGPVVVHGSDIKNAIAGYQTGPTGAPTNVVEIQLTFDSSAAKTYGEISSLMVTLPSPRNRLASTLDSRVIVAPQFNEAIPGGTASITGGFSFQEAQDLAKQLKFGALPFSFDLQTRNQISPTLGGEQLRFGMLAGLIGLLLVIAYSLFQYRALGLVTVGSLVIVGLMTYLLISILGWAQNYRLDMAGVTGLIIAIGVTADSFIVYFERIRDEVREGRTLRMAVDTGWNRARRTILAADGVNFLAALVLYLLASSSVRGFAFTLGLTTLLDILVVFMFTHPVVSLIARHPFFADGHKWSGLDPERLGAKSSRYVGRGRFAAATSAGAAPAPRPEPPPPRRGAGMTSFAAFGNDLYTGRRSIDFIGRRRTWYLASAIVLAIALGGLGLRHLNLGIEFTGGSEFRVSTSQIADTYESTAAGAVTSVKPGQEVGVTKLGTDTVRIQTERLDDAESAEVRTALAKAFGTGEDKVSASFIGPSWGQSVSKQALKALGVFLVLVALVMALYFRTWKMALSALVALVHDMIVTVGLYALSGVEVSPATMIGFLTVLGYSLYDTVVVFDKVRENTTEAFANRRSSYAAAANLAVNQTLVRSINTTVVALLPIGAILVIAFTRLGPGTLLDLALALFIGMAVGAYSSIFIATPLLVTMRSSEEDVIRLAKQAARHEGRVAASEQKRTVAVAAPAAAGARTSGTALASTQDGTADAQVDGAAPTEALGELADQVPSGTLTGRKVHKYAQQGPRNQPRRPPKSKR